LVDVILCSTREISVESLRATMRDPEFPQVPSTALIYRMRLSSEGKARSYRLGLAVMH